MIIRCMRISTWIHNGGGRTEKGKKSKKYELVNVHNTIRTLCTWSRTFYLPCSRRVILSVCVCIHNVLVTPSGAVCIVYERIENIKRA